MDNSQSPREKVKGGCYASFFWNDTHISAPLGDGAFNNMTDLLSSLRNQCGTDSKTELKLVQKLWEFRTLVNKDFCDNSCFQGTTPTGFKKVEGSIYWKKSYYSGNATLDLFVSPQCRSACGWEPDSFACNIRRASSLIDKHSSSIIDKHLSFSDSTVQLYPADDTTGLVRWTVTKVTEAYLKSRGIEQPKVPGPYVVIRNWWNERNQDKRCGQYLAPESPDSTNVVLSADLALWKVVFLTTDEKKAANLDTTENFVYFQYAGSNNDSRTDYYLSLDDDYAKLHNTKRVPWFQGKARENREETEKRREERVYWSTPR